MLPRGWYEVPGGEWRHEFVHGVRVRPDGDGYQVAIYDRHHTLPRVEVRTTTGETLTLLSTPAPRWRGLGWVASLDVDAIAALLLGGDLVADTKIEIAHRARDERQGFTRDRESDRASVADLRRRLSDPAHVVGLLGLGSGARRQAGGGLMIACVWHEDRTPSLSIRVGRDGTIACCCHACGARGDVLHLVAAVHGLDIGREFSRVVAVAAELCGVEMRRSA